MKGIATGPRTRLERAFGGRRAVKPERRFVMSKRYYIAYGSNLNVWQMRYRCPDAKIVGTAVLDGWRLLFKGSKSGAYLTIEKDENGCVPVAVWSVSETDEQRLDRYEGFPSFYYKKELPVTISGIRTGRISKRNAFVYIMHEERPLGIPSSAYIKTCAEGYRDFGFDTEMLFEAVINSREENI